MGNFWYAQKCEPVVEASVINLSDDCIGRITHEGTRKGTLKTDMPINEEYYMSRLACIDRKHSLNYGVNFDNFKKLTNELEIILSTDKALPCAKRKLIACLKKNKNCMIKCRKEFDSFLDCVDAIRVNTVKTKLKKDKLLEEEMQLAKEAAECKTTKCGPSVK